MKRLVVVLSLVVGAWMLSPTPQAQAWSWNGSNNSHKTSKRSKRAKSYKQSNGSKGGSTVPELDPGAAGSAIVLLLGGVALIAARKREDELA
jgi:hypothetical protein